MLFKKYLKSHVIDIKTQDDKKNNNNKQQQTFSSEEAQIHRTQKNNTGQRSLKLLTMNQ